MSPFLFLFVLLTAPSVLSRALTIGEMQFGIHIDSYMCHKTTFFSLLLETLPDTHLSVSNFDILRCEWEKGLTNPKNLSSEFIHLYFALEHTLVLPTAMFPENQKDHTLVLPGGIPAPDKGDTNYTVRILNKECVEVADIVLDYSLSNKYNLLIGPSTPPNFNHKMIYIPCLPFNGYNIFTKEKREDRSKLLVVSFATDYTGRRANFLERLEREQGYKPDSIHFGTLDEEKEVLDDSKILLNIHQSTYHHNLEELRILPALMRGVIVVSESVPLETVFPFQRFIIFANFSALPETIGHVVRNYESIRENLFGHKSELWSILDGMRANAKEELRRLLLLLQAERDLRSQRRGSHLHEKFDATARNAQ